MPSPDDGLERIRLMKPFFHFDGRGMRRIGPTRVFKLEPDPGAVLLITKRIGKVDSVIAWCRFTIVEPGAATA